MKPVKAKPLVSGKTEEGTFALRSGNEYTCAQLSFRIRSSENSGLSVTTPEISISDSWGRELFRIDEDGLHGDPEEYRRFVEKIVPQLSGFPLLQKELRKYI